MHGVDVVLHGVGVANGDNAQDVVAWVLGRGSPSGQGKLAR
ncbi:MAG: hypothetical protein ACFB5Z_15465 [Elainellaceae cyanobacterium]